MTPWQLAGWGLVALVGVAGSALCSGIETGIYCLNRVRLYVRAQRGEYAARLLKQEIDHPERLLASNLIANSVFAYTGAAGTTEILYGLGYSDGGVILVNVLVLTPVFFALVESLPKEVFRAEADRLTYAFAPSITVSRLLLTWSGVLPLVRLIAELAARLIGARVEEVLAQTARDRVAAMLKETQEHGVLSASQAALVDRALVFSRLRASDEMVPWGHVAVLQAGWDRARMLAVMSRTPHTWFPVVDPRSGRVAGVLRLTTVHAEPGSAPERLMLTPARLSPETPLREAIARLREAAAPVGILERDGRPIGLVTTKDLVEPLTGELVDW